MPENSDEKQTESKEQGVMLWHNIVMMRHNTKNIKQRT